MDNNSTKTVIHDPRNPLEVFISIEKARLYYLLLWNEMGVAPWEVELHDQEGNPVANLRAKELGPKKYEVLIIEKKK